MDTNSLADLIVAAVEQLEAERDRLRDQRDQLLIMHGRQLSLMCDVADLVDAARDDGVLTVPEDLMSALHAVRHDVWSATVDAATPGDVDAPGGWR